MLLFVRDAASVDGVSITILHTTHDSIPSISMNSLTPSLPAPSTALPSSATPSTRTPGEGKSACGRGVGIKGGEKESVLVCCRGVEGVEAEGGHRRGPPWSPAAGHG